MSTTSNDPTSRALTLVSGIQALITADDEPSVDLTIGGVRLSLRRLRHAAKPTWLATVWAPGFHIEVSGGSAGEAVDNLIARLRSP